MYKFVSVVGGVKMFDIDKFNNISITRGDTGLINITVYDGDTEYILENDDILEFTVKKSVYSGTALISKTGQNITINPEDTSHLNYGTYYYDVQLTKAENGFVSTIIPPSKFNIMGEVTF